MDFTQLKSRIDNAPSLSFSELFYQCVDMFKKVWLQGLLLQIILIMVSMALMIVFYIPMLFGMFITGGLEPDGGDMSGVLGFLLLIFLCVLYLGIVIGLLYAQIALQAAFYRICRSKDRGYSSESGVGFGMFLRKKYARKILLLVLIQAGISIAAALLCLVPLLYVFIPLQFLIIVFAFYPDLSNKELLELSFSLGTKKWGVSFLLFMVLILIAAVGGFITCGIGFYVLSSVVYLAFYVVYKEMIGFYEDEELIESLGQ